MDGATGADGSTGSTGADRHPPAPVAIRPWVRYPKDDIFEVCGALALAEVLLGQGGHREAAAHVAAAFEVVEAGLTR